MNTVKVRIAVALDPYSGEWQGAGWSDASDEDKMNSVAAAFPEGIVHYWVEVELPLTDQVVQGTAILHEQTPANSDE